MNIFKNKFLVKLITVISLTLIVFMFGMNSFVYAVESDDEEIEGWGGVLVKPIIRLLTGISDGIMDILEKNISGNEPTFIRIKGPTTWWQKWGPKIVGLVIGLGIAAAIITAACVPGGGALVSLIGVGKFVAYSAELIAVLGVGGMMVADVTDGATYADVIYMPNFTITLDKVFTNKVPLLDVNFFRDKKDVDMKKYGTKLQEKSNPEWIWGRTENDVKKGQGGVQVAFEAHAGLGSLQTGDGIPITKVPVNYKDNLLAVIEDINSHGFGIDSNSDDYYIRIENSIVDLPEDYDFTVFRFC